MNTQLWKKMKTPNCTCADGFFGHCAECPLHGIEPYKSRSPELNRLYGLAETLYDEDEPITRDERLALLDVVEAVIRMREKPVFSPEKKSLRFAHTKTLDPQEEIE
jgi:hypothetical protein